VGRESDQASVRLCVIYNAVRITSSITMSMSRLLQENPGVSVEASLMVLVVVLFVVIVMPVVMSVVVG